MTKPSTDLLQSIILETGTNPTHSIIWLHGLGADGNDFVPIIKELKLSPEIPIRFVFPHAPMRPVSINNGFVMRAWYDIFDLNFSHDEDEEGIRDSQLAIHALIEHEILQGVQSKNIILAGFSQGGVMALQTGLRYSKKLAGIIALSCYLPLTKTLAVEIHQMNASLPILMVHGSSDSVIPITRAKVSRDILIKTGCVVEWHEYSMGHTICGQEITDISNWLMRIGKKDNCYATSHVQ